MAASRVSQAGFGLSVDTSQLRLLGVQLRRTAPEVWKVLRKEMRAAAEVVAAEARTQASFSTRIPASIKVKGAGATLKVTAGGDAAPDAAPIENGGKGFVRHPVFGHRDRWSATNSKPAFLRPALDAHRKEIETSIAESIDRAVSLGIGAR